jgi:hypothetical protein
MSRYLLLAFRVDDDCDLSDADLHDLAERIVADIDPDPPVLTWDGPVVEGRPT